MFDTDSLFNIEVDQEEEGILVKFDDDILGINSNREDAGFSITPDWNDRHFTLAFSENSVLYHITQEGTEKGERPGEGDLQPEAFIADVYGAVRALGPLIPASQLEINEIGKPDFDDAESYLQDKGVIRRTENGVTVDKRKKDKLVSDIRDNIALKYELYERVLTPVSIEDAAGSGENIFVLPGIEEVYLFFLFPDDYIGITEIRDFMVTLELLADLRQDEADFEAGSQVMNFLSIALSRPNSS